ncbi:MAG TPA: Rieske 2Fe-2S domain-containing protein [Flavisolibacter sp.]|nr:Rieske 2Fe-2S domain-containing protein [Flavisolibacter sp.]
MNDERRWIKLADSMEEISFGPTNLVEVEADGRRICLGRKDDELFAFPPKCPHAGGYLSEGYIDALGNVVCPIHRYKFCMKNGRNVSGEGYYLKHWPVETREDGIYVGLEKNKLFGLL